MIDPDMLAAEEAYERDEAERIRKECEAILEEDLREP